jgi:hypothetical protein
MPPVLLVTTPTAKRTLVKVGPGAPSKVFSPQNQYFSTLSKLITWAYYQSMNTAQLLDPKPSAGQVKAALAMTLAVAETIREAGEVPSGTLYAVLCGKVDLQGYEAMIRNLKNAGLVTESAHMLKWIGPKLEGK